MCTAYAGTRFKMKVVKCIICKCNKNVTFYVLGWPQDLMTSSLHYKNSWKCPLWVNLKLVFVS